MIRRLVAGASAVGVSAALLAGCYGEPSTECSPNECRVSFSKQWQIDSALQSNDPGFFFIAVDYKCAGDGAAWRRAGRKDVTTATTLSDGDTIRTQVHCEGGILTAHGVDHA